MAEDNYIGTTIKAYDIIGIDETAHKEHKHYLGKCVYCGTVVSRRIIDFKRGSDKCTHYIKCGDIKYKTKQIKDERLSKTFRDMVFRCYDKNDLTYRFYGAKGIKVCQDWLDNPESFYIWAMQNGYKDNLTIDRIDSNKDYEPSNCRWVDLITNSRFKSNTNYITAKVTLSGKQWASLIPTVSINYINRLLRKEGYDATVKFIEKELNNKNLLVT